MKIAIPVAEGKLCLHFGHSEGFMVFEVEPEKKKILSERFFQAPPHEPGLLPRWLAEKEVKMVITGGMGSRAQNFFREFGIEVLLGASPAEPRKLVQDYLNGKLELGDNVCDH